MALRADHQVVREGRWVLERDCFRIATLKDCLFYRFKGRRMQSTPSQERPSHVRNMNVAGA